MGIIDSLSAGFRFLGRRIELILIPVLLDLVIWLAPTISVAPILQRVADVYTSLSDAAVPASMQEVTVQTTQMITGLGESVNLLTALISSSLTHMPSIAAALTPPITHDPILISNSWVALLLWLGLSMLGLLLGVFYMELLARVLPLGEAHKNMGISEIATATFRHFGRVLVYVLLMAGLLLVALIPISLVLGFMILIAPPLAGIMTAVAGGLYIVAFVYLYFVTAAIVLDDATVLEAAGRSIQVVRKNFLPALGFVLLTVVIGMGIGLLLAQVAGSSAFIAVLAIVANGWIGTGLAIALLVFYRSRVLVGAPVQPVDAKV